MIMVFVGLFYLFVDPYDAGMRAMEAKNYESAQRWMLKVPEKHPKYEDAVNLLDEQKGEIGVALVFAGRALMEKDRKDEEVANKEKVEKKLSDSAIRAQIICKDAAVKSAKFDGAESDFMPKSQVSSYGEDSLLVRGQDVKFVNGFGAKRYAEYTGIYSLKNDKCIITDIAG